MPPKRKQGLSQARNTRAAKKLKPNITLTDLPPEILDNILSYVLPDLASAWDWDVDFAEDLLTSATLRTSRLLRQICLDIIHRRIVWIYIEPDESITDEQLLWGLRVPRLPPSMHHLVREDAARAHLFFGNANFPSRRVTRNLSRYIEKEPLIFPFNFERMLYVVDFLSNIAYFPGIWSLHVQFHNMIGWFEHQMKDLVVPALSTFRYLKRLTFQLDGKVWYPDQSIIQVGARRDRSEEGVLTDLLTKTSEILQTTESLKSAGYLEEAGLVTLASFWIHEDAEALLPRPSEWSLGEYDPQEEIDSDTEAQMMEWGRKPSVGRSPKGNMLRSLVHKLECHARLSFAELVGRYGKAWFHHHEWMFEEFRSRFIDEPHYAWFGLTISEYVELYHSSAVFHAALIHIIYDNDTRYFNITASQKKKFGESEKPLSPEQQLSIQTAATFAHIAYMLDPSNDTLLDLHNEYVGMLDAQNTKDLMKTLVHRFTVVRNQSNSSIPESDREVVWCGDAELLDLWRDDEQDWTIEEEEVEEFDDVLRFLPLAQRGLDVSPTFAEWGRKSGKS